MNPRDYDIDELQGGTPGRLGRGRDSDPTGGRDGPLPADEIVRSNQFRELLLLESAADEDLEKPYLTRLPESYAAELTLFEWLEFLMTKGGTRGTIEALQYYESIGWLTRDVEDLLQEYMRSIDEPEGQTDSLDRTDHALSLVYVARLASMAD